LKYDAVEDEMEQTYYEVHCSAFFTGAAPIAYINEPAEQSYDGAYFIMPKIYKFAIEGNSAIAVDEIKSLSTVNTPFSDSVEPKFFFEEDQSSFGYLVEIKCRVLLINRGLVNRAVKLRWCSAIEGSTTTLQSGFLRLKKTN
jgi:hypothetical protein